MSLPDPTPILDLIEAFRRSQTMFAAQALGVFDRLDEAPARAAALADAMDAHPAALERLLDSCVALGLLEKSAGVYANCPAASAYLVSASPHTTAGYVRYSKDVLSRLWLHLDDAVKEGSHRWRQAFNLEGPIFDHFFRTPESRRTFIQGMHGFGMMSSPRIVRAFNLSGFSHIADLGGATGHLAAAACEAYPNLRATVFDLPGVTALAREFLDTTPVAARVSAAEGDFFRDPLPEADLYAVGRILHDWSEEKIALLVERIFATLPSGGALLIAEKLLSPDKRGPVAAHMQSLNMLLCTEGRERTLAEYAALLESAGFTDVEGVVTGAPVDAILARKR